MRIIFMLTYSNAAGRLIASCEWDLTRARRGAVRFSAPCRQACPCRARPRPAIDAPAAVNIHHLRGSMVWALSANENR